MADEMRKKLDYVSFDIALLAQDISTPVYVACKNVHTIDIDPIPISVKQFKRLFYSQEDHFGLNKSNFFEPEISHLTTFQSPRTIDGKPFSLLEEVLKYIEEDLCVTRNCFTTHSLMELTHNIENISTLYQLETCSLVSSLKWNTILSILKSASTKAEHIHFVISIRFNISNTSVLPIIVKMKYKICLYELLY